MKEPQTLHYVVIDAMTSTAFAGNPTPVFILDDLDAWLPESTMQVLAREMQQSETCFVRCSARGTPGGSNRYAYAIRWFTPHKEEPFCGHAVLAASLALQQRYPERGEFEFSSTSGIVTRSTVSGLETVAMEFPSVPVDKDMNAEVEVKAAFAGALGVREDQIVFLGQNTLRDIVIEVDTSVDFSAVAMDIDPIALLRASPAGTRSQVITSAWGKGGADFAKRVFAYGSEDQATGSTYCMLAPYWAGKLGRTSLSAIQVSARTGEADLELIESRSAVQIKACGFRTMEGDIVLPEAAKRGGRGLSKL